MPRIPRRHAMGIFVLGMSAAAVGACTPADRPAESSAGSLPSSGPGSGPGSLPGPNPIEIENRAKGIADWLPKSGGGLGVDDQQRQIQGYASATSVSPGEPIDFHVSAHPAKEFSVMIFRLGWYDGAGARHLLTSPWLSGVPQPVSAPDPITGMIACGWPVSWTLRVPADWTSGLYLAVFRTATGQSSCTPFVVRDDRRAGGLCVILPFTTYQAYNQWPLDGRTGKSLYYGFAASGRLDPSVRARRVSFDRPYSNDGQPKHLDRDHEFIQWAERESYDVTYATSLDLHAGRVDPARYRGLIFCGHDEYWSRNMRQVAERAVSAGSSLAFLAANNVYWHIRVQPSADGRPERTFSCWKIDPDLEADRSGRTTYWRALGAGGIHAEQALLGVQYRSIVARSHPLVVQAAEHWFWAGCEVSDGDQIPGLVRGEADGLYSEYPRPTAALAPTMLSASPYQARSGQQDVQHTHVYETPRGGVVFTAGTLVWTLALNRKGHRDKRVQIATVNLFDRMLGRPTAPPDKAVEPPAGGDAG